MRKAVSWIVACTALAVVIGFAGCQRANAKGKLQIMYSGNIRGSAAPCGCHIRKGGLARLAAFMKRHAEPDAAWLTVDAGNFVDKAGSGGCSDKCKFIITGYSDLRYDVLNLGKQEVWLGPQTLRAILDTTRNAKFVSANLLDRKTGKPVTNPYLIEDRGSLRLGIFGLLNEADFPAGSAMMDTTAFKLAPAIESAKKLVPDLARKTDAVILLADLPSNVLDSLLKAVPQIDLVISAGALKSGETAYTVGQTRIVGTGSSGYNGHYAMLEFNPSWNDSIGFSQYQDVLTDTYDEPGEWHDRVLAFEAATGTAPKMSAQPSATTVVPATISRSTSAREG